MKITCAEKRFTVKFHTLKRGDCFLACDNVLYIVMDKITNNCGSWNAVDLKNGKPIYFRDDYFVEPKFNAYISF